MEADPSFLSSEEVEEILSSLSPEGTAQIEAVILQTDLHSDIPWAPPPTPEPAVPPSSLYDELSNDVLAPNQQNPTEIYYPQPSSWPDPPIFPQPCYRAPHLPSTQPGNEAIQPEKEALNYVSTQPGTEALNSQPANEALNTVSLQPCRRALHLPPVRPGNEALNPIPTQPGYPSLTSASPSEYQARLKPVLQLPPAAWTSGP